jgi:hypothetical protein
MVPFPARNYRIYWNTDVAREIFQEFDEKERAVVMAKIEMLNTDWKAQRPPCLRRGRFAGNQSGIQTGQIGVVTHFG